MASFFIKVFHFPFSGSHDKIISIDISKEIANADNCRNFISGTETEVRIH